MTAFVHHNTLHAFQQRSFEEGVRKGGELWSCHAYLSEERHCQGIDRDRIRLSRIWKPF
ncbi:MAG: putative inorganic carbon transporter subunit DabA [Planctomycetaceae bacterium]